MTQLMAAEKEYNVRILFAIESGSRAWGFGSSNSDYDVRFIYMHKPALYQAIDQEERKDVIEYPIILDNFDINGWDVRKALRLLWKSNPSIVEWLQSPIVYIDRGSFRNLLLAALPQFYAPEKGIHHYRSIAKTNYRVYLQESKVKPKKYFYVLGPLLAAKWMEICGTPAPIEFATLLTLLSEQFELLGPIHKLLDQKRNTHELGMAPAVLMLTALIENALKDDITVAPQKLPDVIGMLSQIFHAGIQEYLTNPQ